MSSYSIRATAILPLNSQPLSGLPLSGLPLLPIPTNPSSQQSQGWLPRFVFLRPNDTDKTTTLTLLDSLAAYLAEFESRYGLKVAFWPPPNPGPLVPPNVEEQAIRILQEALTNVARHAQATRVDITFRVSDRDAQITVADDGRGFEIGDWGLRTGDRRPRNLQSPIQNPKSPRTLACKLCASAPRGWAGNWRCARSRARGRGWS